MAKAKQSTPQASKAERERVLMVFRAAYEAGDLAGLVRCPDRVDFAEAGGELALVCHREGRVHSVDTVQITDGLAARLRDGRLKPVVGAVRPLAEAPSAFTSGKRTPGKTIIRVTEDRTGDRS